MPKQSKKKMFDAKVLPGYKEMPAGKDAEYSMNKKNKYIPLSAHPSRNINTTFKKQQFLQSNMDRHGFMPFDNCSPR